MTKKKTNRDDYPYYKSMYKLDADHINDLVAKLNLPIMTKPNKTIKRGVKSKYLTPLKLGNDNKRVTIIQFEWNKHTELNNLTDYFTEPCRIRCHFLNNPSPLEYWNFNNKTILENTKSISDMREYMYHSIRLCNNFRIVVALTVVKLLKSTHWLDISAGWGDRLLTALLSKSIKYYCGVDPNPCLHPHYDEMIAAFKKPSEASNYVLIKDGFEKAKIPNKPYDLVFSSPPFFNLEVYSDVNDDSLIKNPTEQKWFVNFLMPSIMKAISLLISKGYLVLYMGESKDTHYIIEMKKRIDSRMNRCGSIYYQNDQALREFLVWQKK